LKHKLKKPRVAFLLRMSEHPLDIEVAAMVTKAAKRVDEARLARSRKWTRRPSRMPTPARASVTQWLVNSARLLDLYPEARHGEFDPNLLAGAKAARERYTGHDL